MILPTCQHCGQTLPITDPIRKIGLTDQQSVMVEALRRAGEHGLSTEMLIERMYRGTAGGPVSAGNVISVQKKLMRRKLEKAGYQITIENRGRMPGVYRLVAL